MCGSTRTSARRERQRTPSPPSWAAFTATSQAGRVSARDTRRLREEVPGAVRAGVAEDEEVGGAVGHRDGPGSATVGDGAGAVRRVRDPCRDDRPRLGDQTVTVEPHRGVHPRDRVLGVRVTRGGSWWRRAASSRPAGGPVRARPAGSARGVQVRGGQWAGSAATATPAVVASGGARGARRPTSAFVDRSVGRSRRTYAERSRTMVCSGRRCGAARPGGVALHGAGGDAGSRCGLLDGQAQRRRRRSCAAPGRLCAANRAVRYRVVSVAAVRPSSLRPGVRRRCSSIGPDDDRGRTPPRCPAADARPGDVQLGGRWSRSPGAAPQMAAIRRGCVWRAVTNSTYACSRSSDRIRPLPLPLTSPTG